MADVEHNALLLQVMAHDLLAPLTAVKWQIELLGRKGLTDAKRAEYLESMAQSTKLGITLTKHAHVAGRVLTGAYDPITEEVNLADRVKEATMDLQLQYDRHGLAIAIDIVPEDVIRQYDISLLSLYVWAVAKLFLSVTAVSSTVSFQGIRAEHTAGPVYTLVVSAAGIEDRDKYVQLFEQETARDAYDQHYVFVKLIRAVGPLLGIQSELRTQENLLVLETTFA